MRERDIFIEALQKADPAERAAYLDTACAGDDALRMCVSQLLVQHEKNESFLLDAPVPLGASADTIDQASVAVPGTLIGPYKLLEAIGEGGMGMVWMAQQTEPVKRLVALKLIKAGMDSRQVIARFEAERQALALMDHPNIARVLDGGMTSAGRPYFVMDLVKGASITKFCDEHHLTPRQRLELFLPVCQAVQHAHQKGIIHRDLKPSNVLVALYDGRPMPKVIDFGVAKAAGQSLTDNTLVTGFGNIVGTLEYMSPEQAEINQLDIDTRSDIYSLGVLLYELLVGSPPFTRTELETAGMLEMLRVIREQEPSKPSTKLSTADGLPTLAANRGTEPAKLTKMVRGELDWIVMKALEKDRNRRYETANGFAMDVQRYLADESVLACPPSAGYRLRKFARRNKGGLAVAALALFFLVLLGSGAGWAWRDRSAREAEAARQQGERQSKSGGQIKSIFAEVDRLESEQKWPDALAAARRAEAVVAGGEADAETTERVRRRLKDLEFIDRLEQIRMERATAVEGKFNHGGADREYGRAFRDYGVDVNEMAVETAIDRLGVRPALALPLAAVLDDWVHARRMISEEDVAGWKQLVAIARGIDPEPLRDRLRSTWGEPIPTVQEELRRLVESIDVRAQHPATLVSLGRTLRRVGNSDSARRLLRNAQFAHPGDFWLNFDLGLVLDEQKKHEEQVRFQTAAVAIRPYSAFAHNNLGNALLNLKKPDEAVTCFQKAIEIDPEYAAAYNNLGIALRDLKKFPEAGGAYRKAIKLDPKLHFAYNNLGSALRAQKKPDEAITCYQKAIELDPRYAPAYHNLGAVLHAQKKPDEAIAFFRKAIEIDPKNTAAYNRLGAALRDLKKLDEAVTCFRKAIEIDPKNVIAFDNLGTLLCDELKEYDQAVACFRTAIKLEPDNANNHGNLGAALLNQGKLDDGIAACRKALEIDPKHPLSDRNIRTAMVEKARSLAEKVRQFRVMKNAAGCLAVAAEYEDLKLTDTAGKLYNAACIRALCVSAIQEDPKTPAADAARLAREQADLAMAWLHKAVASGYKDVRQMKQDKDLDVLRDREDFKKLVADLESRPPLNTLAWELAIHPDPSRRDPKRAAELAEKAVSELPKDANCWNTLGVARYRVGDYKGSVAALMKYRALRTNDAEWTNPFFLAMAHRNLDHKGEVARWYKLAVEWMDRKKADSETMRRIRAEAAELLAVERQKD
jgi:tetratricopeptide (TPR) repeat protein